MANQRLRYLAEAPEKRGAELMAIPASLQKMLDGPRFALVVPAPDVFGEEPEDAPMLGLTRTQMKMVWMRLARSAGHHHPTRSQRLFKKKSNV